MRLVRFPAVRRAISGGLDRAVPEKIHVPAGGAFVRFRLEDPRLYHPALFSTLRRGARGTLIVIGTPLRHIKRKAALEAFLRRMGWRGGRWTRRLSADERRSMIYQIRSAGLTGGSRAQAVLIPRPRVEAVAARFLARPAALRKVGGNPVLYHRGVREDRLGGVALQPHPSTVGPMSLHYTKASGRKLRTIRGVEYAEVYDSRTARPNPILATLGIGNPRHRGNAYACYKCGKRIKGEVTHHVPPVLHERLGVDFKKAFHPECYKEWQAEAGRELGIKNPRRSGKWLVYKDGRPHGGPFSTEVEAWNYVHRNKTGGILGRCEVWRVYPKGHPAISRRKPSQNRSRKTNPLTRREAAFELRTALREITGARKARDHGSPRHAAWLAGRASGRASSVHAHLRAARPAAERIFDRAEALRNPGVQAINVPFRNGQKVTPAEMRRWLSALPAGPVARQIRARFEQAMRQYKRFHLGSEPRFFTYRAVPMGSSKAITDVDMVVSEGKEWAATYQVPRHSGKYEGDGSDGRYVHAHGDSDIKVDIRRPVKKSLLPERFHTADGKFVGVIPRPGAITDWYRK